jgi:membrane associated rhomboid family serine protease
MSKTFMDQLNDTPVTYAVLLIYLTMAYLTSGFVMAPETDQLVTYGAAVGMLIHDGESWRILSNAFLHGGLIHLGINSYALLVLGPSLERYLRTWRFIVLYIISAAAGSMLALLFTDEARPLIGGSGALFGMLGAALAINIRGGRTLLDFMENRGSRQLIGIIFFNLLISWFIPFISNAAHVGGLIAGFVVVFGFFDVGRRGKIDRIGRVMQGAWIAMLLSLALYVTHPVLSFDFNLKQFLREEDPGRKQQLHRYLDQYDEMVPGERNFWFLRENEPKTGIPGVARREFMYEQQRLRRVILTMRRWKNGD